MAALLVGMSVAAILMTAAMPAWKQMARREREAELVFRGQQYARAIGLFQKKSGPGVLPPSVDVLVSGHYLRKKFKDPITNEDFDVLSPMLAAGGAPGAGGAAAGGAPQSGQGAAGRGAAPSGQGYVASPQSGSAGAVGGIIGVASKSKEASLRVYNGRTRYNEWQFIFVPQATPTNPGAAPGGAPGGQPQRGGQPPSGIGGVGGNGGQGGRGQGRGQQPPGPGGRGGQAPPVQPIGPSGSPFGPRR